MEKKKPIPMTFQPVRYRRFKVGSLEFLGGVFNEISEEK
jgi:hypothetical protein